MIIAAPNLLIDGAFTGPAAVAVEQGIITAILPGLPENPDIRLDHGFLTPGLIDLHNNGAFGVDFCSATPAQWEQVISRLAAHGVTSLTPTIITAPLPTLQAAAARLAEAASTHPGILGLHLEGPFLSPQKPGVHQPAWLQAFDPDTIAALLAIPGLRIVTLAPELPGALAAIRQLVAAGITVALGHTAATAGQTFAAADAGARLVTHVFTAQSPLHHRAPGAAGAALTDQRLFPCVIADAIHMDPIILKLVFAASPNAIAVTDSILAAGMEEGFEGEFGGARIILKNGVAQRPDGTFAGAAITLDQGIRRLIAAGIAPETAFAAATERPATALGLTDRGRIAPGQRADLVWWNNDFTVAKVWRAGRTQAAPKPAPQGTEYARPELSDLDQRPTLAIVNTFLAQEAAAQRALTAAAPRLATLADAIAATLQAGGRLFYAGAGTSGRLALLDAVECGPTFGVGPETIIPLLAGGDTAFLQAVEGAEDNQAAAVEALAAHNFTARDALVGIAASGATPFTLAAIRHANALGALTGAIVNNRDSPLAAAAKIAIEINSGPEIIAGSTRLSAGTTQKIALNILSTTVMIRLGKTHGPYMVDLRATNKKLIRRATRITATLAEASEAEAEAALTAANMHVKTAILLLRLGITAPEAAEILDAAGGSLRKALGQTRRHRDKAPVP
jgi:N-acetylmuramic acid 6-phosphate etherase/N-acetylglucosamine-6-phosphate deacetylase